LVLNAVAGRIYSHYLKWLEHIQYWRAMPTVPKPEKLNRRDKGESVNDAQKTRRKTVQ